MTEAMTEHDDLSTLRAENARLERALKAALDHVEEQTRFNTELWEALIKVRLATLWQHLALWWRSV
jgi:hypothetical protein